MKEIHHQLLENFRTAISISFIFNGDYSYHGIKRDIEAVKLTIKEAGFSIFNEYDCWAPLDCIEQRVFKEAKELCLKMNRK